jgi:hypothetical protein
MKTDRHQLARTTRLRSICKLARQLAPPEDALDLAIAIDWALRSLSTERTRETTCEPIPTF